MVWPIRPRTPATAGITRQPAIGLLPWKTLGLAPLEDADGECLWYAVSGDFKEAADLAATTPVNADSDGAITVTNEAGNSLATKLVAVVFAPGAKLGSQVRTNSAMIGADRPCATPTSATPSGGAAVDVAGYLESGEIDTKVTPPAITFKQLTATVDKQSLTNDQLTWITAEDYAAIALQRNAKPLETAFSLAVAVSAADGRLPFAADTPGGQCKQDQYSGFLPGRCSYTYIDTTIGIEVTRTFTLIDPDEWQKLAFYAVSPGCNSPGCTAALGLPGGRKAKAVLLIRGRQQANQTCLLSTTTTAEGISDLDKWWPCIKTEANRTEFSKKPTDATQPRTFITPDKHPTFKDILKEFS